MSFSGFISIFDMWTLQSVQMDTLDKTVTQNVNAKTSRKCATRSLDNVTNQDVRMDGQDLTVISVSFTYDVQHLKPIKI